MSLIHRLTGQVEPGEDRIPVNEAMAAFGEMLRGHIGLPMAASKLGLTPEEVAELGVWMAAWDPAMQSGRFDLGELRDVLIMGEAGLYTISDLYTRLGLGTPPK